MVCMLMIRMLCVRLAFLILVHIQALVSYLPVPLPLPSTTTMMIFQLCLQFSVRLERVSVLVCIQPVAPISVFVVFVQHLCLLVDKYCSELRYFLK